MRLAVTLLALLGTSAAPRAHALVLDSGDGRGNTTAPAQDPGWRHVGHRLGGPSVIYLGDGWVLTANHVGAGVVVFDDRRYDPIADSPVRIFNDDGSQTDLLLFRIAEPPDLPPLPISRRSPRAGEWVMLIGTGSSRGEPITVLERSGPADGFIWQLESQKRWGTNYVASRPQQVVQADTSTRALLTLFNRIDSPDGTREEAQAATGDSGGAVFAFADPFAPEKGFVLAGLMFTVTNTLGRPKNASFYGDATFSADLAHYRDRLIAAVRPACSNELDDDGDGFADFPTDRGCDTASSASESDGEQRPLSAPLAFAIALAVILLLLAQRRRAGRPAPGGDR